MWVSWENRFSFLFSLQKFFLRTELFLFLFRDWEGGVMSVEHVGVRGRKRLDDNWSLGPSRELAQQASDTSRELAHQTSGPSQELAQPVLGHFREHTCDSSGIFRYILFENLYCTAFS
jgi:hypothetical protein